MKKSYDRKTSTQVAVRFPSDVYTLIRKRKLKGATFSAKLFAAIRRLDELENGSAGV